MRSIDKVVPLLCMKHVCVQKCKKKCTCRVSSSGEIFHDRCLWCTLDFNWMFSKFFEYFPVYPTKKVFMVRSCVCEVIHEPAVFSGRLIKNSHQHAIDNHGTHLHRTGPFTAQCSAQFAFIVQWKVSSDNRDKWALGFATIKCTRGGLCKAFQ